MDTKRLEEIKQIELKFRNKIIELEKQLQYENLRANEYETKFKEAVMDNSLKRGDQELLAQLTEKQSQIYQLRKQLLEANRKMNETRDGQDVEELMRQNLQMRNVVEQLKNAAIAAIMEKDAEIQAIKQQVNEVQLAHHARQLEERVIELEQSLKTKASQYEQEIKKLNQKLSLQRDGFSQKLTTLHRQFSSQENQKEKLIEKAQSLQGNLQNLQKVVEKYESKIGEIQNVRSSEKITFAKTQYQMQRKIDNLLEDIKNIQKNQQILQQTIINLNKMIQDQKKKIENINQEKEELDRKLKIKNRKTNAKQSSSSIYQSFEGFSKKADVYASFAKRQNRDITKESFIGQPIKLSDIKQIEIEEIENFNEYVVDLNEVQNRRKDSEDIKNNLNLTKNDSPNQALNSNLKAKTDKIAELESKIQKLLDQIDECNKVIDNKTKQLQKQRQDKLELKQKLSTSESQIKVQRESLRLHVYKLENALLIEKLQNAQKLESNKQIREYQKKMYEQQINKLKLQIQNSKKKKGFFK